MSWWRERTKSFAGEWWVILSLSALFLALYLPQLGSYGLFDPWETHYGEVARDMWEKGDYIDPYWGSPWDTEGVKRERAGFYSKPPLTMWMMAGGMSLFGHNELGVRFFFPLLGLIALLSIYLATSRLVSRRAGLIATLLCGFAPSFSVLTHQAVTDGPLVCLMTIGAMCLALAIADARDGERASSPLRWLMFLSVSLSIFGQLWVIWPMDQSPDALTLREGLPWWQQLMSSARELWWVAKGKGWVIALTLLPLAVWTSVATLRIHSRRLAYLTLFYVSCGLMVGAKGWLGWAPLGGALITYLLISREWALLRVAKVRWGLLIVLLTGHIWVLAMLGGHHPDWFNRFIKHDHINRLFLGVHSTDDGASEYFVQWLAYGLFPMIALLPAAFARLLRRLTQTELSDGRADEALEQEETEAERAPRWGDRSRRYELLLFGWFIIGFFLFSRSNTKFHHYIFPLIPPAAIMIALWLEDVCRAQAWRRPLMALMGAGVLLWVGGDLVRPSAAPGQGAQQWVNLFTYKYDRDWPMLVSEATREQLNAEASAEAWLKGFHLPLTEQERAPYSPELQRALLADDWHQRFSTPVKLALALALVALLLMALPWLSAATLGVITLVLASLTTSLFILHSYLPTIAPHWSQGPLWSAYYQDCAPFKVSDNPVENRAAFERQLLLTSSRVPRDLERFPTRWCAEPVVSFRMNWRGETFYTGNTVTPILYAKDLKTYLKSWEGDFYMFTERKRIARELEPALPKELKGRYREIYGEGLHFALLKFERERATKP